MATAGGACLALMTMQASSSAAWITLGVVSMVVTALLWGVVRSRRPASKRDYSCGFGFEFASLVLILCYAVFGFGYIIPRPFFPRWPRKS